MHTNKKQNMISLTDWIFLEQNTNIANQQIVKHT